MASDSNLASGAMASRLNWAAGGWALGSTLAFSVASPIAKAALGLGLDPTLILMVRFWATAALLGATTAVLAPAALDVRRRDSRLAFGIGLVNGAGMLAYFWSLTRIDASVASMIFSLFPLAVLGLLALRGEKFTYRHTVRLALGLGGVILLVGPGGRVDLWGVLLVGIAILSSSLQSVGTQWYLPDADPRAATFFTVAGMAVVTTGFWLAQGAAWQMPDARGWAAIVILALVSTYFARMAWIMALRGLGGSQLALLMPLETLLTVIWSVVFLDERLAPGQIVGGGLILLSMLLALQRLQRARWPVDRAAPGQ